MDFELQQKCALVFAPSSKTGEQANIWREFWLTSIFMAPARLEPKFNGFLGPGARETRNESIPGPGKFSGTRKPSPWDANVNFHRFMDL